jgi:hypothetical protein
MKHVFGGLYAGCESIIIRMVYIIIMPVVLQDHHVLPDLYSQSMQMHKLSTPSTLMVKNEKFGSTL